MDRTKRPDNGPRIMEEGRPHDVDLRELSRQVHDRIAHSVLTVLVNLDLLEAQERDTGPVWRAQCSARDALEQIRDLAARLRAGAEPDRRLAPAAADAPACTGDRSQTPDEVYLVVREAVRNALIHADANHVTVDLRVDDAWIDLVVQDDGQGFEPHRLTPATSVGLSSMRERAEIVGGRVTVASAPRLGTRVRIGVPNWVASRRADQPPAA
jgi:signal transduction histidine kinase